MNKGGFVYVLNKKENIKLVTCVTLILVGALTFSELLKLFF